MKSKTLSSDSLFRRCLKRYWPVWLGLFAVLLFSQVFPLASELRVGANNGVLAAALRRSAQERLMWSLDEMPILTAVFGLAAAMAVFEHVYSPRLSGLFASLPVRREKVFRQHWLAGAVMLVCLGVVTAALLLAVEAVFGAADLATAASWLGFYCMEAITFYGIASFCVMLTGHVLVIPALFLLFNAAGSALNIMLGGLVQTYTYGVQNGANALYWLHTLSPVVKLASVTGPRFAANRAVADVIVGSNGWGWVIGYFVVGLILTALALRLFRRRDMERALDTTAFPVLRPILKYVITVFFALGVPFLVLFFLDGFSFYGPRAAGTAFFGAHLALTVLGAVIGYFLSEMIIRKSLRAFDGKGWAKALLVGALCCGVVCLFRFDGFGISRRVPAPETVQSVHLRAGNGYYNVESEDGIAAVEELHREILSRRSETEAIISADNELAGAYLDLNYLLENGKVLNRAYFIPDSELLQLAQDALNGPALLQTREELSPPVPIDKDHVLGGTVWYVKNGESHTMDLSVAQALALYEGGILPDCQSGTYGKADLSFDEQTYLNTVYTANIELYLKVDDMSSSSLSYQPTVDTTYTNAWLESHNIPLVLQKDGEG